MVLFLTGKLDQEAEMIHGRITFIIALIYIILGLAEWPSECSRGSAPPGVYELRQIVPAENPSAERYDSWVNQLQRKKERGR